MGLSGEAAITLIVMLLLAWGFIRIVNGTSEDENPIEFWHFFASYNERTRKEHGDVNSLGMVVGIVACVYVVVWTTYKNDEIDAWALALCLVYLGGVKAFASWLRMVASQRYGVAQAKDDKAEAPVLREITHTTSNKTTTTEPPAATS